VIPFDFELGVGSYVFIFIDGNFEPAEIVMSFQPLIGGMQKRKA
jgi:hypothetical protein